MPTYTYRCDACGHEFEQVQKFSDDPLTECPECTGSVRRVLYPAGIIFKGSGWYITDSRKPAPSEDGGSDKAEKSGSGKSSDSKAESAAAAD
ncbi:MAG TPA: FmdB family zinc ribbon protein [Thermomicrobiales bacterium]